MHYVDLWHELGNVYFNTHGAPVITITYWSVCFKFTFVVVIMSCMLYILLVSLQVELFSDSWQRLVTYRMCCCLFM